MNSVTAAAKKNLADRVASVTVRAVSSTVTPGQAFQAADCNAFAAVIQLRLTKVLPLVRSWTTSRSTFKFPTSGNSALLERIIAST